MTFFRPLVFLSASASVMFLLATPYASDGLPVVFKVASIALLAVLGFRVNVLLGSALIFGALGDFLLGVRKLGSLDAEKLFLFGLGAFLVGHLLYIALFWRHRGSLPGSGTLARALGILVVVVTLGSVLAVLRYSLGSLLIPVVLYAVVLCAMAISAMLADLGNTLAATGALCFVASDAMLAIGKFRSPLPGHEPLIWITYYLAQLLIFVGIAKRYSASPVHP